MVLKTRENSHSVLRQLPKSEVEASRLGVGCPGVMEPRKKKGQSLLNLPKQLKINMISGWREWQLPWLLQGSRTVSNLSTENLRQSG